MKVATLVEKSEDVFVPGIGPMQRVELRDPDGEPVGLEYRWPTPSPCLTSGSVMGEATLPKLVSVIIVDLASPMSLTDQAGWL